MTKDEALNHALQLVSNLRTHSWTVADTQFVITAIKEALANEALEKKAENARELGLNYEPVAYVKTVIEALYENSDPVSVEAAELLERITTPPQRTWVGLTDEERHSAVWTDGEFGDGVLWAEKLLKERNT